MLSTVHLPVECTLILWEDNTSSLAYKERQSAMCRYWFAVNQGHEVAWLGNNWSGYCRNMQHADCVHRLSKAGGMDSEITCYMSWNAIPS